MKKYGKIDDNQPEIVVALREMGFTVQSLANIGGGCPDLLIGKSNRNYLVEIKDPNKPPSKRKLTPDQETWHYNWMGQVDVAETVEDILEIFSR